jgi:hypothetical protein
MESKALLMRPGGYARMSRGARLFFTCPKTGLDLFSGIYTDLDTLARVGKLSVKVPCSHCGDVHTFAAKEGHLESPVEEDSTQRVVD